MNSSRRAVIRELLTEKPFISLRELEEQFPEVSSMTLRRDIEYFEKQGDAIKVRGGARSMKFITTSMEDSFHHRLGENMSAKEKIARRAIELIETGRSLFLDSGTTVLKLAAMLPDERHTITSKLDRSLPFTFCDLASVHTIVADDYLPDDITAAAEAAGVEIIVTR